MLINRNYFMTLILLSILSFNNSFTMATDQDECYKQLQEYCDCSTDPYPGNFMCARQAVILYNEDDIRLKDDDFNVKFSVNIFFTEVIFPNVHHAAIKSPEDFCNIRGEIIQSESTLNDAELYLADMQDILNTDDAVKKCTRDLKLFNSFYKYIGVEAMFKHAFFKMNLQTFYSTDKTSFGINYMEYISRTIDNVGLVNPETDTPQKFCQKFNYGYGKRGTE